MLGRALTKAFKKEVNKLANAQYLLDPNYVFNLAPLFAKGRGLPSTQTKWDPVKRQFYTPGSAADLQRWIYSQTHKETNLRKD